MGFPTRRLHTQPGVLRTGQRLAPITTTSDPAPTRKLGHGALVKNPVLSARFWLLNYENALGVRFLCFSM